MFQSYSDCFTIKTFKNIAFYLTSQSGEYHVLILHLIGNNKTCLGRKQGWINVIINEPVQVCILRELKHKFFDPMFDNIILDLVVHN